MPILELPGSVIVDYTDSNETGNEEAPVVLYVAPWAGDISFLYPLIDKEISFFYRIVCVNMRSHGTSATPNFDPSYSYLSQGCDFALLMQFLKISKYGIISIAAMASQACTMIPLLFPENITFLISIGPIPLLKLPKAAEPCMEVIECWKEALEVEEYFEGIAGLHQFYSCKKYCNNQDLVNKVVRTFIRRYTPTSAARVSELTRLSQETSGVTKAQVNEMKTPTLLLHGNEDCWVTISEVKELMSDLTGSVDLQLVEIPGPHMIGIVFPELVNSIIKPFIARYSEPLPKFTPLNHSKALRFVATAGKLEESEVLARDPLNPNSYSHWSKERIEEFRILIAGYETKSIERAKDFDLNIGRNPEPDSGEPEDDPDSRWEWTRRKGFHHQVTFTVSKDVDH